MTHLRYLTESLAIFLAVIFVGYIICALCTDQLRIVGL